MPTYSLLQISLDHRIDRESLEEASEGVPSVAKVDCALMARDLFGIVVSGLAFDEASAFQVALKRKGFPTELVADDEIPVLHDPFTIQRIEIRKSGLVFTAMMDLQELLPNERVGSGLKRPDTKNAYPSLRCYEEEIRWHFYRLGRTP